MTSIKPIFSEVMFAGNIDDIQITHHELLTLAQSTANELHKSHIIGINQVDIDSITDLNEKYRHKPRPTNVLTFVYPTISIEPYYENKPDVYGEVFVCDEVIAKEAYKQNKSIHDHCLHIILHGILHVHGLDHESVNDANRMEMIERTILKQFNISDPYETHY